MSRAMRLAGVLIACTVFVLALLFLYRSTIAATTLTWLPYGYSELLINYKVAFVRRGLLGTFILHFVHGASALRAVSFVVFVNVAVLASCLFVMALLRSRFKGWTAALVLLIPSGVFHMAFLNERFYRKEVFFFAFLSVMGVGISAARPLPPNTSRKIASCILTGLVWIGAIACSLVHEGFVFLAAPAAMYLLIASTRLYPLQRERTELDLSRERRHAALFIGIMVLSFIASERLFQLTGDQVMQMYFGLPADDLARLRPTGLGGIGTLGASFNTLWSDPLMILQNGLTWWYLAPVVLLMLYCSFLIALNMDETEHDGTHMLRWLRCYGILGLGAAPMLFLGWDWGRWISSVPLSFLPVWLALREEDLFRPLPRLNTNMIQRWIDRAGLVPPSMSVLTSAVRFIRRNAGLSVCFLLFFALTFRLPELMLADSYIFIGRTASDWVVSHVQHHAGLLH